MKCEKCGMMLPDDSEFCQYCGTRIEQSNSMPLPLEGSELSPAISLLANNAVDYITANSRLEEKHTSDPDYGLVPEKPVFTFLVDGAEAYLDGLVSEDNEELTWNREGSMPVTGVSGPVDIYASRKKKGQQYKTLYVSIYGKANSTTIPKGFARKGARIFAPADIASESGVGRNTTTETQIGLKSNALSGGGTTTTYRTDTQLQPQQPEMLYEDSPNTIQENIPVLLEKVSLYHDPQAGNLAAKCTFRSLTEKSILAMMIDVHCTDVWGTPTDSVEGFQYLDLRTTRGMVFGQDKEIPIPNPATRFVEIEIKKVIFADRSLAEAGHDKAVLPDQQPLLSFFGSEALTNEYRRETGINAQNTITEGGGYWRCTCSAINSDSDDNCYHCNAKKSDLLALQNIALITSDLEAHQKEMQAKAEHERVEREAFKRQAEEKARLEREEKERKSREDAARIAEEMRIKKEQHSKKVKRNSIIVTAVMLILFAAYALIWHIIPSIRYANAETALKDQQYDDAYEKFLAIDTYKDSAERAKEALYQKGFSLMNSGSYSEAAIEFSRVSDYKNSREQETLCRNQMAYLDAMNLLNSGNYKEAADAFALLSDFSDSIEQEKTATYQYAKQLFDSERYLEAHDTFEAVIDYEDSASLADECYYRIASRYFEAKEYNYSHDYFRKINHYKDSKDLMDESYYLLASDLFDRKKYADAESYFSQITTYKDSLDRSRESKYLIAKDYINGNDYKKAIEILETITFYEDAAPLLVDAKYNYAQQLAQKGSYKEAMDLFKSLEDYNDSASKYIETKYQYGVQKLNSNSYKDAVSIFEDLGNYEDSKTKLNEAKYGYVLSNKNRSNKTTYNYLEDLKSVGYKDSKSIYADLYQWYIEVKCVNTNPDDFSTTVRSVDKYCDYLHFQFILHGGTPGEEVTLSHRTYYPDGQVYYSDWYWENKKDGNQFGCEWSNGVYSDPYHGSAGTFTIKIYNKKTGELIGEASIRIT